MPEGYETNANNLQAQGYNYEMFQRHCCGNTSALRMAKPGGTADRCGESMWRRGKGIGNVVNEIGGVETARLGEDGGRRKLYNA